MSLLPKSIHRCRRYPTKFNSGRDIPMVECESVSLSRGIPSGLAWMLRTYVESVPRESLEKALLPIQRSLGKASNEKDGE